jgi:hypothetical protein
VVIALCRLSFEGIASKTGSFLRAGCCLYRKRAILVPVVADRDWELLGVKILSYQQLEWLVNTFQCAICAEAS